MFSDFEGLRGCHFRFFLIHALRLVRFDVEVHALHLVGFDVEVHALHLVEFDIEVFLPLEQLPATANESVLPGVLPQFILFHLCSRWVCSLFRLLRCWDYYLTHSWDLFQGWIWLQGSGGLKSDFSFS